MHAWPHPVGGPCCAAGVPRGGSRLQSPRLPSGPRADVRHAFPREARLRKRKEYVRIQRGRRGKRSDHFVVLVAPGLTTQARLGVTVSRRIGSAVTRNRVKRRVREFFRLIRGTLQPAQDIVIIARAGAEKLSFKDVADELAATLGVASPRR